MTFMRYEKPQLKPEINSFLREGPINLLNPSHMPQLDHKINWSVTWFKSTKSLPIHAKCILPELASLPPLPLQHFFHLQEWNQSVSSDSTLSWQTSKSFLFHRLMRLGCLHTHLFVLLLRYKTGGILPRGKLVYLWFSAWSHRHTEIIQIPDENFRIIGSGSQEIIL